jgi:hypothetical protein
MMKQLLFCFYLSVPVILMQFSSVGYAQEQAAKNLIKYTFEVQGIEDFGSAKEMTDFIRPLFNTPEEPFGYFPRYIAEKKQFEFESAVQVTEAQLSEVLNNHGLVLISFTSVDSAAANTSK